MFEHPHVLAIHSTTRPGSIDMASIYVVETDLTLSRDDPAYDEDAVQDLFVAAKDYLEANPTYDTLKIVPYRER
jgi:hypothetical protein